MTKKHLVVDEEYHTLLKKRAEKKGRLLRAEIADILKKELGITENDNEEEF